MKIRGFEVTGLLAVALVAGCNGTVDTKRWSSMTPGIAGPSQVSVRVYVAPADTSATNAAASNPMSGWSDRAQGAFITAMAARTKGAAPFKDAIAKSKTGAGATTFADVDGQKRLLVVTLTRPGSYAPADRIARVVVRILPVDFTFSGYTLAQTARTTVNVTALTRSNGLEEDLSVGAPTGAPITGSAGLKATSNNQTVTPLTEAPETLTVDVIPSCMRIVQEGAHSVDLTGNIKISTQLVTQTKPDNTGCDFGGVAQPSDVVAAPGQPATYLWPTVPSSATPNLYYVADSGLSFKNGAPEFKKGSPAGAVRAYPSRPLTARVLLEFWLRRVTTEARSYDESVQDVQLLHGFGDTCQPVMPVSQLMPPLYQLAGPEKANGDPPDVVRVKVGMESPPLLFPSIDAADAAEEWINKTVRPKIFGGMPLEIPIGSIAAERFDGGPIAAAACHQAPVPHPSADGAYR